MTRIFAALFLVAFAATASADAAATYAAKCKMCHGANGEGGAMAKAPIAGTPADKVLKAINDGAGKMKPVKIDDAGDVAKYVAGLKK
ncbi:MAG TPA: c-type cytochrome [Anaeromyxobacteraceae bacterium]|nr:c-type cytochrome [Anaeromyxobacteraceae bacterium]